MWVEEQNGKYKYVERYLDPMTGKYRRVSVTLDKNTKQAEKMAREILREKMQPQPPDMTLGQLVTLYLSEQEATVKASTLARNQSALKSIKAILGENTRCESLSAGYIRRRLLATEKQAVTLNEYIARLKALLRWGYRNDYIADVRYLDKLEKFKDIPRKQKVQDKFIEAGELAALADSMHKELWRDLTMFLALSGLRFGEAAALLRSDVDVPGRAVNVDKTYDQANDITTEPKTYASARSVYMQDELAVLCRQILNKGKILSMSNLFFCEDGEHIHYNAYRIYLRKHSLKVLGRVITPHTLRHTHASLLMEQGVDIETISARLGHADSRVTKEIYLHVTAKLQEKRNRELKEIRIIS